MCTPQNNTPPKEVKKRELKNSENEKICKKYADIIDVKTVLKLDIYKQVNQFVG